MAKKLYDVELYRSELKYVSTKGAERVRGAIVSASLIEGQLFALASKFLKSKDVHYKPIGNDYYQSVNILSSNEKIDHKLIKKLERFREKRNNAIHGIVKGMTRTEWEEINKQLVIQARPIIIELDKKLTLGLD